MDNELHASGDVSGLAGRLVEKALEMRKRAYAPYSGFTVGAALLGDNGKVYGGCNIENASYPAGNCAERSALCAAVSDGERKFRAIAIAGGKAGKEPAGECPPCGICRQMLREFCPGDFPVILAGSGGRWRMTTLESLLPDSFGPDNL